MSQTRFKPTRTNIPGVYFIMGTAVGTGKPERIYYVSYYRNGKRHFEAFREKAFRERGISRKPDASSRTR